MRWRLFGAALLLVVGVGAVLFVVVRPGATAGADTQYLTARVTRTDVIDDVAANGSLEPVTRYGLAFGVAPQVLDASSASSSASSNGGSSSTTWPVSAVKVTLGQSVKKGAVLATADASSVRTQLSQLATQLVVAEIQQAQAVDDLNAATTTQQTRQAQISYYNAKAQVAQLVSQRSDLNAQLARSTITAPADGVVEAVNVVTGADAPSGAAIVLDTGGLDAQVTIAEADLSKVHLGQTAAVAIAAADGTATGTVSSISPVASSSGNSSVVNYAVVVSLTDVPTTARAGMTASVTVTIASATNVLAVPAIALLGNPGAYTVRLMAADGSVTSEAVSVGLVTSNLAEVQSGLSEGQTVVVGVSTARTSTGTTTGGLGGLNGALGGGGGFRFQNGGGGGTNQGR